MSGTDLAPVDDSEWWQHFRAEWSQREAEREEAEQRRSKKDQREWRRRMVAQMLLQGVPRRTMGSVLGVGQGTIQRDVDKVREEWKSRAAGDYDSHVSESLARLDKAAQTAITLMADTALSPIVRLEALGKVLSTEDRRSRLLGLDKPAKVQVSVDPAEREARALDLMQRADELAARRRAS